jgi:hypothetical protein
MDGGSGINVIYASTLDDMGIPRSQLQPSITPFHGVVPVMEVLPIGQIDLPVTFVDLRNFRTETLTFVVVGFSGTYLAILGRLAYAKFMVVPNYTYLKLKILGPKVIITIETTYQRAFECDAVVWTSLGPLPQWVPGPTTRWAPGTTRLGSHGT